MYIFQPDRHLIDAFMKRFGSRITGDVLDLGCGSFDRYSRHLSHSSLLRADLHPGPGIDVAASADALPFSDQRFDAVICTQVLGDVPEPVRVVAEISRVLKPSGRLLLTESFYNELHDEPHDYWRFTPHAFQYLLEQAGFVEMVLEQRGGFFVTLLQTMERYCLDRFRLHARPFMSRGANRFFQLCFWFALKLDELDRHPANRRHAIGWCVYAKKP